MRYALVRYMYVCEKVKLHCMYVCMFVAAGFGEEWAALQEEQTMMDDPAKVHNTLGLEWFHVRTCSHAHAHHMYVVAHTCKTCG